MPASRGEWHEWMKPGAREAFANEYPELDAEYPSLFNVETSSRAEEFDLVSAGLGTAAEVPEGEDIPLDQPKPRGKVTYTHTKFGLGYEVTEETSEDDLYDAVVPPSSRYLARSHRDVEERMAASVFNNAFSSQQAYDGVSLINTAHPTVGAGTIANRPATDVDLSVAALQASMERYMLMEDDRGLRIKMMPERVVHHPTNFWLAREILQSENKPFTANNEKNVLRQQGLTPFTYTYLTDTDSWYTLASKDTHKLNFFWRRQPRFDDDFDKRAQTLAFFVTGRFSYGATDWRGIDGSNGA